MHGVHTTQFVPRGEVCPDAIEGVVYWRVVRPRSNAMFIYRLDRESGRPTARRTNATDF
jgi:hypothetical protein